MPETSVCTFACSVHCPAPPAPVKPRRIKVTRKGAYWNVGGRRASTIKAFIIAAFAEHDLDWLALSEVYDRFEMLDELEDAGYIVIRGPVGTRKQHNALVVNPAGSYTVGTRYVFPTRPQGIWIGQEGAGEGTRSRGGKHVGAELIDKQIVRSPVVLSGHHQSSPYLPLRRPIWHKEMANTAAAISKLGTVILVADFNKNNEVESWFKPLLALGGVCNNTVLGQLKTFKRKSPIDHGWLFGAGIKWHRHQIEDPGPMGPGRDLDHAMIVLEYTTVGITRVAS